jgi:hypothetical protein
MNVRWGAALVLTASVAAGCGAHVPGTRPARVAVPRPVVHDLRTLADLATVFDQDRDHPRIVLLLSPT